VFKYSINEHNYTLCKLKKIYTPIFLIDITKKVASWYVHYCKTHHIMLSGQCGTGREAGEGANPEIDCTDSWCIGRQMLRYSSKRHMNGNSRALAS
jgi:hypothetical protein